MSTFFKPFAPFLKIILKYCVKGIIREQFHFEYGKRFKQFIKFFTIFMHFMNFMERLLFFRFTLSMYVNWLVNISAMPFQ